MAQKGTFLNWVDSPNIARISNFLHPRILNKAWFVLSLTPMIYVGFLIYQSGTLPDNDYWSYLRTILVEDGISLNPSDWLRHDTEHLVLIPKVVYAVNVLLTGGDNRFLGLTAFIFAGLEAALLASLSSGFLSKKHFWLAWMAILIFVFTPRAVHNWMMGMSGVAWIGANLVAVLSIYHLCHQKMIRACLAGCLGYFVYSSTLGIWPALLVGSFLQKFSARDRLTLILITSGALLLFYYQYHTPADHPSLAVNALTIFHYVFIYLGGFFTNDLVAALNLGVLGLIGLSVIVYQLIQRPSQRMILCPWVMLQIYAVSNAGLAAIARSGFGLWQAISSRYATLPALFWLGLVISMTLILSKSMTKGNKIQVLLAPLIILCAVITFQASHKDVEHFLNRSELKKLASISIYTGAYDLPLLTKAVTPVLSTTTGIAFAQHLIPLLKQHRHVPFDGTFKNCPKANEKLFLFPFASSSPAQEPVPGFFDHAKQFSPHAYKVNGWVLEDKPRCIVITNQIGIVRGIALSGFPRPDINDHFHRKGNFGWIGYARTQPGDERLFAYVLAGNPLKWSILNQSHPVEQTGTSESQNQ